MAAITLLSSVVSSSHGVETDTGRDEPSPAAASDPPTDSSGTPPRELSVLTYNINWAHGGNVKTKLLEYIRENQPDVITLNEFCESDFDHYIDELADLGYAGHFAENNSTLNCGLTWPPDLGMQGSAVFVAGGSQAGSEETFPDIGQGTACITSDATPQVRACAVHLSSGPKPAARELKRLQTRLVPEARDMPLVLGGDFNLEVTDWENEEVKPFNKALQEFYDDFHEVDMHAPMCRKTQPADLQGRFGGACTKEHPDQGWKKIDFAFVDNVHFTPDVSGEILDLDCTRTTPGVEPITVDVACSDHEPLAGTAAFDPSAFPEPELTVMRYGISTSSALDGGGIIGFGLPADPQNRLSAALGEPSYAVSADEAAPECAEEVDDYVVWGTRNQPTLATAVADLGTGPALVGYRLYEDVAAVQVPDEGRIGYAQTMLPTKYTFFDIGLEVEKSQDSDVAFQLTGAHPYPDLGKLDGSDDDSLILERGAGIQCRLDTLIEDPLVEPLPDGTWRWTLEDRVEVDCFSDVILECTQLAWDGTMELNDDNTITGKGQLDWEEHLGCVRRAIGQIDPIKVTARQSVTLDGRLEGNVAELELTLGEPRVNHAPVPDCINLDQSYNPDQMLASIAEFDNFLSNAGPVQVARPDEQWYGPRPDFRVETKIDGRRFEFSDTFECANEQCE